MKQELVAISVFILPALYLSGFFFAVRQVVNSTEATSVKAVLILGLICFLLLLFGITFLLIAWSSNPWAH